jgi:osmotically-inducible protein OsmY
MSDRTYRSGRERYERDRSERDRGYGRQAEQFDAADYGWRDDERNYGQMGDGWREEDYGQSGSRDREAARDWGRDPSYRRSGASGFGSQRSFGGGGTSTYGAGSQLAANHGEWRETYGASPSRENRDYRDTWGGSGGGSGGSTETGRRDPNERGFLERAGDTIAHWLGDDADYQRGERGYRGQGPSGYSRSDDRIMEDACDALTEDWGVDARQISVQVSNGEVTLDGTVPSRQQKRRAEDLIDDLSGVKHVQNNLRVQESTTWDRNNRDDTGTTGAI